jgi:hypothetical protein
MGFQTYTIEIMRRSLFLVLTLTTASILGWFINAYEPDNLVSILLFSLLSFSTLLFLALTITRNLSRSLLISACISAIFLFRAFSIRNSIYAVLLILFFILVGIIYERSIPGKKL